MTSNASKFERYIIYHTQKEMMRERERMIFSNEFYSSSSLYFYKQSRNKSDKNFYVKSVKTVLYVKFI